MRIPSTPPDQSELFLRVATTDPGRLGRILALVPSPLVDGQYVHWDKLRLLKPPSDLTHEEWWLGLKTQRLGGQAIPLRDRKDEAFTFQQTGLLLRHLHDADLQAGGQIGMPDQVPTTETRDTYIARSLIEEAFTSSQLEGAASTREIAKELIRSQRTPRKPGERMILNNYRTMQHIRELQDVDLTPEVVFEIHRIVTEGTLDDPSAAGRLRRDDEYRVVADDYETIFHQPPPADQLRDRMERMCRFANDQAADPFIHPVIRSMILHFWLAYDHPFVDGNGRTARALFYWSMLRRKYWLCEFISISSVILKAPVQYGRAFLHTETDSNDLTYFLIYHADVLNRAIDEVNQYVKQRTADLAEIQSNLRGMTALNYRQRELIRHALRHPGTPYTFESHRASHGITLPTARKDLLDLLGKGLLQKRRVGRQFTFSAPSDLEQRLKTADQKP